MPSSQSLTDQLIEHGRQVSFAQLPADVLQIARHCVLDWIAVTLAGVRDPACRILFDSLARHDRGDEASLLGLGRRTSLRTAALVHGTAAHALDFDDTHWGLQGHPTAPVLSGLFALAEREAASGAQLLAALVAGIEVECRLGQWLNPGHYARGYHATATLGTFGAAAAAAHLLGLSHGSWQQAFGLAGTQAAGLKSAFGTAAKPLQVGRAAEAGLMSALLAAAGYSAHPQILDDAQGFVKTHGDSVSLARGARPWSIRDNLFKYHAACYLTHATIEALRALRQEQAFDAQDVRAITLSVDETCLHVCNIAQPRTGTEAKFSLRSAAALAVLGAATEDPATFSDESALAPAVRALAERVRVTTLAMPATRTEVAVELGAGSVLTRAHDAGVPEQDLGRQERRLCAKLERLVPLSAAARDTLRDGVLRLHELGDVRELASLAAAAVEA